MFKNNKYTEALQSETKSTVKYEYENPKTGEVSYQSLGDEVI